MYYQLLVSPPLNTTKKISAFLSGVQGEDESYSWSMRSAGLLPSSQCQWWRSLSATGTRWGWSSWGSWGLHWAGTPVKRRGRPSATYWQGHLCCCRRGCLLSCSAGSRATQHQQLEHSVFKCLSPVNGMNWVHRFASTELEWFNYWLNTVPVSCFVTEYCMNKNIATGHAVCEQFLGLDVTMTPFIFEYWWK